MNVGYARVSMDDQSADLQVDALKAAGCEKIFVEKMSGKASKFADREQLHAALEFVRSGDTLVVWRLDRIGRSLKYLIEILEGVKEKGVEFHSLTEHIDTSTPTGRLMFHFIGAMAEFERDLIRERTVAGLKAARARGHFGGRKRTTSDKTIEYARYLYHKREKTVAQICEEVGISLKTFYRYVKVQEEGQA